MSSTASRGPFVAAALLVALAFVPGRAPAQATRTEDELRRLFTGSWYLTVSRSSARSTIDAAIERAVGDMNYFLQSMARDQLTANTPVNERIDLDFPGGRMYVRFDGRFEYTSDPGIATDFPHEGGTINITQYFRDGHLEHYYRAALGERWSVHELDAAGTTMTVVSTQQGLGMPSPMVFRLTYRQRTGS